MEELILQVLTEMLKLVAIIALTYGIAYIRQLLGEQRFQLVQKIVSDGVLFAQQVYGHLEGKKRYEKALERISLSLADYGIEVSEEQLDAMIEATVKALKKEFGDEWYPDDDEVF